MSNLYVYLIRSRNKDNKDVPTLSNEIRQFLNIKRMKTK
jgi:hypothetical protein